MTITQSLYDRYKRYRTLQTHAISALPVVILMPHSACNCRCVMCDIWKGNKNLKQLSEDDISDLLGTFKKFGTQQVVMSGGEALLHPLFFRFCEILRQQKIKISLLSTGISLKKHAAEIVEYVNDIIVSLDGDPITHNRIRNLPGAFEKLQEGIATIRQINSSFQITGRTVIHRLNFRKWAAIIDTAALIGIDKISFLPADVSSHAFNREILWNGERQLEIVPAKEELRELELVLDKLISGYQKDFESGFIAESPEKLRKILKYYSAYHGLNSFPYKKCNAPWVSTVIEADGTIRPCFFHEALGNIRDEGLEDILNSQKAIEFRKNLDIDKNETCMKCVCYLNLSPGTKLY